MTGATGNIYCGLHEFTEMGFLLHLLRPEDVFLDIGANVGSYTILATKVCGARTIAFEPDSVAAAALCGNIALNQVSHLATVKNMALGDYNGEVRFTSGLDTTNRVARENEEYIQICNIGKLDDVVENIAPTLIKLDVEGFEERVIAGGMQTLASPSLLAVQTEFENADVRSQFASLGFEPVFYDPFSRKISASPMGHAVSNTIFVRRTEELIRRLEAAPVRTVNGVEL